MTELTREDRRMLADGISAILGKTGVRGDSVGGYPAQDPALWRELGELGILALSIPQEQGGLGLGFQEIGPVMRALGGFATVEPFVATVVLGAGAVLKSRNRSLHESLLPSIASSELKVALAYAEPDSRHELNHVSTRAIAEGDAYVLTGHKAVVLGAPDADRIVVSARTAGNVTDNTGIALFVIDRTAPGVTVQDYFLIDGRRAGEVMLQNVRVSADGLLAHPEEGLGVLERVIDEAAIAACYESVGVMERLNELTLEYCRERFAFGQPIAKNQVIQHRLVDMHVAVEHASAMVEAATEAICDATGGAFRPAVSAAKVSVARESKFVGEAAVQLHGAGGTTEDVDVGRYFKRLLVNMMLFGDADHHLQRFLDTRSSALEVQ
jgi:alkylation response protein AidB-like acyl-CoA dehydrogenase